MRRRLRAAPGRSRAVAVCVCGIPIVYHRSLDRTYTETLDQPRARVPARWSRPHWYQCLFAHKGPHAHLAPTHMCRCAHAISVPPNPFMASWVSLARRNYPPARVGNPGMPSARTHPPHCRQRAAVTTVCGQLCATPPLLRCQLANGHACSWPLSLCMACAAISHQASLSSISA